MVTLGLDIGSRTVDAVWLEGGRIVDAVVVDSGFDPQAAADGIVGRRLHGVLVATGYGRHLARERYSCPVVTEIKAHGLGAHHFFPDARSVLDIGGQDTKVMTLDQIGRVTDFEMNDKCAAGTGRFLEVMARALGYDLEEMAQAACRTSDELTISSMCTVFAESEVTSLVHKGADRAAIARGLHQSIVRRTVATLKRIAADPPLVFAGGVARNQAMVDLLSAAFPGAILVAPDPQISGALGAALSAEAGLPG